MIRWNWGDDCFFTYLFLDMELSLEVRLSSEALGGYLSLPYLFNGRASNGRCLNDLVRFDGP